MPRTVALWFLMFASLTAFAFGQASRADSRTLLDVQRMLAPLFRSQESPTLADELQITNEQLVEIAAFRQEITNLTRERRRGPGGDAEPKPPGKITSVEAAMAKLNSILTEDQLRRLSQLELQQEGPTKFLNRDFGAKFEISAAQRLRILDVQKDLFVGKPIFGPAENAGYGHACYAILNEKQRAQWNELVGLPSKAMPCRSPIVPGPIPVPPDPETSRLFNHMRPYTYLERPIAEEQLRLTATQAAQLKEERSKYDRLRSDREKLALRSEEYRKATASMDQAHQAYYAVCDQILTDEQKTRLNELQFQALIELALLERAFRDAANLSDDQINSIDRMLHAAPAVGIPPGEDMLKTRQEKLQLGLKLLTDAQRQVWTRMAGPIVPPESLRLTR